MNPLPRVLRIRQSFPSTSRLNIDATLILASAKKHGVASGIHVADAAQARRRIAEGWQFIAIASEAGFMLAHAAQVVKDLGLGAAAAAAKY